MSRLRVFRQTGWFIAGLMTGLPATAAPAEASSMAGVAVAVATTTPPDATATLQAIQSCRRSPRRWSGLTAMTACWHRCPRQGLTGRWSKPVLWARPGPAPQSRKTPRGQHHRTAGDAGAGERPTVVITTPAIGHVPPRPVLMFSCVDNITRMQVALMHPLDVHDIAVTLNADNRALRSHWFVRENGTLLESSRGYPGLMKLSNCSAQKR